MLRLAEYQVRLLLCTPDKKNYRSGGRLDLFWNCGCRAAQCGAKKFAVDPCEAHAFLLMQIPEGEEPVYEGAAPVSARGSV